MAKFIGRQQEIGIAREAARGTLVAPTFWMPKINYNVNDKVQKGRFQGNYGVLAGGDDALVTQKWAEGDMEFEVTDKTIALILYALFGSLSSADFQSVRKHTLSLNNSVQHQSLSLMMNDPIGAAAADNETIAFAMAMINSFELSVELGELVRSIVNFISKPHTDYARQTSSFSAENKFAHHHLTFKIAANEAGLDAASAINLQSLNLSINKNVIRENAHGTVQPVDILNRMISITGSIMLTYESQAYRDYMLDGDKKAVRITLQNTDVTIGSTNPTIQIDLPVVDFEGWEASAPLDDIATQEITFTALFDVANSILIGSNTYVVNETNSY